MEKFGAGRTSSQASPKSWSVYISPRARVDHRSCFDWTVAGRGSRRNLRWRLPAGGPTQDRRKSADNAKLSGHITKIKLKSVFARFSVPRGSFGTN